jgi:DNA-directed RNA polymerase subunit beta
VEFANDVNNVMYAYIDRKKKFPVTIRRFAPSVTAPEDILDLFTCRKK